MDNEEELKNMSELKILTSLAIDVRVMKEKLYHQEQNHERDRKETSQLFTLLKEQITDLKIEIKNISTEIKEDTKSRPSTKDLELLTAELDDLRDDYSELKKTLVLKTDFNPIRLIVYGLVGITMAAVLTTILGSIGVGKHAARTATSHLETTSEANAASVIPSK